MTLYRLNQAGVQAPRMQSAWLSANGGHSLTLGQNQPRVSSSFTSSRGWYNFNLTSESAVDSDQTTVTAATVWPASLPQLPRPDDYEETLADNTVRSSVDVGPAKLRRRTTSNPDAFTLSYDMVSSQVADLITFYRDTLVGGTQSFDMTHPRTGLLDKWRFTGPPKIKAQGEDWIVNVTLEQLQ